MEVLAHNPIEARENEKPALKRIEGVLSKTQGAPKLVDPDGGEIELPQSVFQVLKQIVSYMMRGRAIFLVPDNKELTTQEAADLLCVSRPYFVKLLDEGKLPYVKVGSHRRVRFTDLMRYQKKREQERSVHRIQRVLRQ